MLLVEAPERLSRLHASRRLFATLKARGVELPVVHHLVAPPCQASELALQLGMQVPCPLPPSIPSLRVPMPPT